MPHDAYQTLEKAFGEFIEAYEQKTEEVGGKLKETLKALQALHYSKSDLTFAFGVEPLTVERWWDGKGMRAETFTTFTACIRAILAGKSQRPVRACNTGFVTWRYQIEHEQTAAKRIWNISSSRFILLRSLAYKEAITNLFSQERQQEEGRDPAVKIYLYPPGGESSETESSLLAWDRSLQDIQKREPLRGSVIGIKDSSLPWFLPGVRALLLEKTTERGAVQVEGYLRVRLQEEARKELLLALDALEDNPHTPWLAVHRETAVRWYTPCLERYGALVDAKCQQQAEANQDFAVHYITLDTAT